MTRLVGLELEIGSGAEALAGTLHGMGSRYLPEPHPHEYHCSCSTCEHDPERRNLWTAQEDCSVDGEFVTKPLAIYSTEFEDAIETMGRALFQSRAIPNMDAGNHVHVDRGDFRTPDYLRLYRLWARYEGCTLERLGRASFDEVRGYNAPFWEGHYSGRRDLLDRRGLLDAFWTCDPDGEDAVTIVESLSPYKGPWLSISGYGTFEFRMWNTTRTAWRMRLHAAVSAACVEAAKAGVNVTRNDRRHLLTVLRPFLDDEAAMSYRRQMAATA